MDSCLAGDDTGDERGAWGRWLHTTAHQIPRHHWRAYQRATFDAVQRFLPNTVPDTPGLSPSSPSMATPPFGLQSQPHTLLPSQRPQPPQYQQYPQQQNQQQQYLQQQYLLQQQYPQQVQYQQQQNLQQQYYASGSISARVCIILLQWINVFH